MIQKSIRNRVVSLALASALIPELSVASSYRNATPEELRSAYCLAYLKASGPTPNQLSDPSAKDGLTQGFIAQHQAIVDRFDRYLKPRIGELDPAVIRAESKRAADDFDYMRAPRVVDQGQLLNDPVVKRAVTCVTDLPTN